MTEEDIIEMLNNGMSEEQINAAMSQATKPEGKGILEHLKDFTYYGASEDLGNALNLSDANKARLKAFGGTIDAATTAALFSPAAPAAAGAKALPTITRAGLNAIKKIGGTVDVPALAGKRVLNFIKPQIGKKVSTRGADVAAQRLSEEQIKVRLNKAAGENIEDVLTLLEKKHEKALASGNTKLAAQIEKEMVEANMPNATAQIAGQEGRDFARAGKKSILLETMPERIAAGVGHVGGRAVVGNRQNILEALREKEEEEEGNKWTAVH